MEILRCTWALLLLSGILVLFGIAFGDSPSLIGATFFLLAAGVHALTLTHALHQCVHSLHLERTVSHRIMRQGDHLIVTSVVYATVPHGYQLTIRDEAPRGTAVVEGTCESSLLGPSDGAVTLRYTVRLLARGTLSFQGLTICFTSRFFRYHLLLGKEPFTGPLLLVQPAMAFASEESHSIDGAQEIDRLRAVQGQGIRAYRLFRMGDDVKAIDWKLSAKHRKLILREYAGRAGDLPFFVFDLPSSVEGDLVPMYDRLVATLTERIEQTLREYHRTNLMVLSGGRVIRSLCPLKDARVWYRLQHQLVPGEGYMPLYRFRDAPSSRSFLRRAERSLEQVSTDKVEFLHRITRIMAISLALRPRPILEHQVFAALRTVGEREVVIYSLLKGDLSHLHQVISVARSLRMRVHLRHPARSIMDRTFDSLVDSVEVIT